MKYFLLKEKKAWPMGAISETYNFAHINLELFDILLNFFSWQVKRSLIFSKKNCTYELPHKLLNDLKIKKKLEN